MDERIIISVEDRVKTSVHTKFRDLGKAADEAGVKVERMKSTLRGITVPPGVTALATYLKQLNTQMGTISTTSTGAAAAIAKIQAAMNTAALTGAKLATEHQKTALAAQRLATESQRTATALSNAAAAATRASTANQQLAAATSRAAEAASRASIAAANAANAHAMAAARLATASANATRATNDAALSALRLTQAQREALQSTNALSGGLSRMQSVAASVGASLSAIGIIGLMDQYSGLNNKIKMVTDSAAAQAGVMEHLREISTTAYADLGAATTLFARMDRAMSYMGRSQEDTLRITETITKAIAVGGLTAQEASSSMLQLSQAFNSGRLNGDEFRSVSENMPMFLDAVAKATGRSRLELKKMSEEGQITSEVMIAAFELMGTSADKAFAGVVPRIGMAFTNLKTEATVFFGELDKSLGITSAISNSILWMSNNLELLTGFVSAAALVIGGIFTKGLIVAQVQAWGLAAATAGVSTAAYVLRAALIATGIGALIVLIGYGIAKFLEFSDAIGGIGPAMQHLGAIAMEVIGRIPLFVQYAVLEVSNFFMQIPTMVSNAFTAAYTYVTGFFANAVATVGGFISTMTAGVTTIPELISRIMTSVGSIISGVFSWLYNQLPAPLQGMVDMVADYYGRMGNIVKGVGLRIMAIWLDIKASFGQVILDMVGDAETFPDAMLNVFNYVVEIAKSVGSGISNAIGNAMRAGANLAIEAIKWLADKAIEYVNGLIDAINALGIVDIGKMGGIQGLESMVMAASEIEMPTFKSMRDDMRTTVGELRTQAGELRAESDALITSAVKPVSDYMAADAQAILAQATAGLDSVAAAGSAIAAVEAERANNADSLRQSDAERQAAYDAERAALDDANKKKEAGAKSTADEASSLGKILSGMDEEIRLLQMMSKERDVEKKVMDVQKQLKEDGVSLSEQELSLLREKVTLLQRETELARERDAILGETLYKREQELTKIMAISQLQGVPGFTSGDTATAVMSTGAGEFLAGGQSDNEARLALMQSHYAQVQALRDADLISQQEASAASMAIWIKEQQVKTQKYGDFFGGIAQLASSGNERLAAIGKAAAIAQAMISTYQSATSAYASMAAIPVVGPALGAAAAAAAVAAGLANVAAIRSQSTAIPGYRTGGYTGDAGVNDVAGVVHGQEYVMTAAATSRIGVQNLESLQRGTARVETAGETGYAGAQGSGQAAEPVFNFFVVASEEEAGEKAAAMPGSSWFLDMASKNKKALKRELEI